MTGSEKAGSAVGEVAGRHMKKVVLELGGSDPFLVLDDADVDAAAKAAVIGRLANGGQACTASKRFIVEDRVYDEFVAKLVDGMAGWQPGDPTNPETKMGPLASSSGAEELDELVQEAISRGAEVLLGGNRSKGAYYSPTVLARVTRGMRAYREELFGPVAVVYRVGSVDEAIELANDLPFGLASSVFTSDPEGRPGGRATRDRHGVDQQHQQDCAGPAVRRGQGLRCRTRAGPVRIRRIRQQEAREKPERTTEMTITADTQDTRDRSTAMVDDRYQRGLDRMMELVSTEHTNTFDHAKLVESYKALDPDLPDYIVSFAFGDIYSRTSLTQQEQTLVTISTLVALGTEPQLKLHINTGFNVGLTKEKIVGALIHCIPYVGFPRVLNGLTLLKEVMAERGLTPDANAE